MPAEEPVEHPVARVAVDVSLSHLDRPFDYAVPAAIDAEAVRGARVRVRFAGKLRDGFILERAARSDHDGELTPLHKVISAEPVLTAEIARLIRRVADHYAGCFADVMRLAVPPRHAATEKAPAISRPVTLNEADADEEKGPFIAYPYGLELLQALREGRNPRAAWQLTPSAEPSGDWAAGLAGAARATVKSGRGAVLVVPDQRDLERLRLACVRTLGEASFVVLTAELGPAARYRAFLAALRGDVPVVIGTRAAAFAPVHNLGLVALVDDGDDLLAELRAPYPHARDVLALRAADSGAAAIFAGYARTAEIQGLLERGWLRELAADHSVMRHTAPRVKVTADSDLSLERDSAARSARMPHEVFEVMRAALPQGPVLVQVPRAGYLIALVCQTCREPARCTWCGGPTRSGSSPDSTGTQTATPYCSWCGRLQLDWACAICGSQQLRAPIVGAERTAEELGKAFPNVVLRQSVSGNVLATVPATTAIVVATPGAEPRADGGYAAAVLLDTTKLLLRSDLRATEEALRRWLNVVALVRSGADGGSVIAVGESSGRALQALVRLDPAGLARRELAERAEAHFPPAVKMILVEGRDESLAEFLQLADLPEPTEVLGPVEMPNPAITDTVILRLTLRAPLSESAALVKAVKAVGAIRSARKSEGALRIRVDPTAVG